MNRKVFIAEDYANRILQCKQRLFEFYKQNGYLEEIEKVNSRGGEITTLELDEIENRLRSDYQKEITESNQLTK